MTSETPPKKNFGGEGKFEFRYTYWDKICDLRITLRPIGVIFLLDHRAHNSVTYFFFGR